MVQTVKDNFDKKISSEKNTLKVGNLQGAIERLTEQLEKSNNFKEKTQQKEQSTKEDRETKQKIKELENKIKKERSNLWDDTFKKSSKFQDNLGLALGGVPGLMVSKMLGGSLNATKNLFANRLKEKFIGSGLGGTSAGTASKWNALEKQAAPTKKLNKDMNKGFANVYKLLKNQKGDDKKSKGLLGAIADTVKNLLPAIGKALGLGALGNAIKNALKGNAAREKARAKERAKEKAKAKEKERAKERAREKEKAKEKAKEREKAKEKEKAKAKEKEKAKEKAKAKEREKAKAREKVKPKGSTKPKKIKSGKPARIKARGKAGALLNLMTAAGIGGVIGSEFIEDEETAELVGNAANATIMGAYGLGVASDVNTVRKAKKSIQAVQQAKNLSSAAKASEIATIKAGAKAGVGKLAAPLAVGFTAWDIYDMQKQREAALAAGNQREADKIRHQQMIKGGFTTAGAVIGGIGGAAAGGVGALPGAGAGAGVGSIVGDAASWLYGKAYDAYYNWKDSRARAKAEKEALETQKQANMMNNAMTAQLSQQMNAVIDILSQLANNLSPSTQAELDRNYLTMVYNTQPGGFPSFSSSSDINMMNADLTNPAI